MGFAEGVTASNQRDGFLVIHSHTRECLADVLGSSKRIRITVWPFRVHVNQAHLHGSERVF
jgi:hypothetical protein